MYMSNFPAPILSLLRQTRPDDPTQERSTTVSRGQSVPPKLSEVSPLGGELIQQKIT